MAGTRLLRPLALLALVECLLIVSAVMAGWSLLEPYDFDSALMVAARGVVLCACVALMMYALGLYSWHIASTGSDMLVRVAMAFLLAGALFAIVVYLFEVMRLPARTLAVAILVSIAGVIALRVLFLRLTDLAELKSRILVLGAGAQAKRLAELEKTSVGGRFKIVRFLALEEKTPEVPTSRTLRFPKDLAAFARRHRISELVLALDERRGAMPLDSLIAARLAGIAISDYQAFREKAEQRIDVDALRPSWFYETAGFRNSGLDRFLKRVFDLVLSLALLVFTLPLLVATAIAIRLESPGPVFYRQQRIGLGGRPFVLIKFRSMREDAERDGAPQWARESDPRVTRVGGLIRKTRIDEIPQILNVLRGDMSFVGPRPERPEFVEKLARDIPFYLERHAVRPGITGWAQLNYPYGASVEDAREKLRYDLFYIKYFSIVFDLSIALQTVRVILWSDGAR